MDLLGELAVHLLFQTLSGHHWLNPDHELMEVQTQFPWSSVTPPYMSFLSCLLML